MQTHAEFTVAVKEWFAAHLPDDLFTGDIEVTVDREEITVVGPIAAPDRDASAGRSRSEGEAPGPSTSDAGGRPDDAAAPDDAEQAVGSAGADGEAASDGNSGADENSGADGHAEPGGVGSARRRAAIARAVKMFRETTRHDRVAVAREAEHAFGRKVSWGVRCDGHRVLFTTFSVPVMTRLRQPERQVLDTLVDSGVARSRSDAVAWCVRLVGRHTEDWLGELREAVRHVERVRSDGPDQE